MAGTVLKKRRLVNPGRRRKMTAKQIKYFGTSRQKAALKHRRRNAGPKSWRRTVKRVKTARRTGGMKDWNFPSRQKAVWKSHRKAGNRGSAVSRAESAAKRAISSVESAAKKALGSVTRGVNRGGRRKNVGEILTVVPAGNPGRRRKSMSRTANRRRHTNRGRRPNYRRANPKVVVRYRNRRHNRAHHRRRRNPDFLQGNAGAVVGVLGGALLTKTITSFLPATFTSGVMGYVATGAVAVGSGQLVGRMMKDRRLGNMVTLGGLLILGLQLLGQFVPGLQLPFGLTSGTSGMGLLTSSNFYVPQVNMPGSMASFVTPAGIPAPVVMPATGMRGLGAMNQGVRRFGRLR